MSARVAMIEETPVSIRIRVNKFGIAETLDKPRDVVVTIVNERYPSLSFKYPSDEELSEGRWPAEYEAKFLETVPAKLIEIG
jgi:hypothetical protein